MLVKLKSRVLQILFFSVDQQPILMRLKANTDIQVALFMTQFGIRLFTLILLSHVVLPLFAQEQQGDSLSIGLQNQSADSLAILGLADSVATDTAAVIEDGAEKLTKIPIHGQLNEEQRMLARADVIPLSLTQRGRAYTTAYRGMPAGFFQYQFEGYEFDNPVMGFWNEQLIGRYQYEKRIQQTGSPQLALTRITPPKGRRPQSRVVFTQDYGFDINMLDVNLNQRFSPGSYYQLSGSNFSGRGAEGNLTGRFTVNNYYAQGHFERGEKWSADVFYWQLRQRFNMGAGDTFSNLRTGKFKQVGHLFWVGLLGKLSENDVITITPEYTTFEDRYWENNITARNIRYHLSRLRWNYQRTFGSGTFGVKGFFRDIRNEGEIFWREASESDTRLGAYLTTGWSSLNLEVSGGIYRHSELASRPYGKIGAAFHLPGGSKLNLTAFSDSRPTPLLWRSIDDPTQPAFQGEDLIEETGVSAGLQFQLSQYFQAGLEAFSYQNNNVPAYIDETISGSWKTVNYENSGVSTNAALLFKYIQLHNEFSYNRDFETVFGPQFKNVATAKVGFNAFNNALRIEGITSLQSIDGLGSIFFDRRLNLYRLTEADEILTVESGTSTSTFNILDARIQAYFNDAVLFVIWENILSTKYRYIETTVSDFRVFRVGVNWLFYD